MCVDGLVGVLVGVRAGGERTSGWCASLASALASSMGVGLRTALARAMTSPVAWAMTSPVDPISSRFFLDKILPKGELCESCEFCDFAILPKGESCEFCEFCDPPKVSGSIPTLDRPLDCPTKEYTVSGKW